MAEDPKSRYDNDEQLINDPAQEESVRQQARLRQAFWQARFKKLKKSDFIADNFVGLWANLVINSSNVGTFGGKRVTRKDIEQFFKQPLLQEAIKLAGESAEALLQAELTDSARIYFSACKTDSRYGSYMLGIMKLKEKEVANKAAREAANSILAPLIYIGRPAWSDQMIRAAWHAWQLVFTETPQLLDDKIHELDVETARQINDIIAGA